MHHSPLPALLLLLLHTTNTHAFIPSSSSPSSFTQTLSSASSASQQRKTTTTTSSLNALTERQLQFWEDVQDGLVDVENFYKSDQGLDIDRIYDFAKSAQGLKPKPKGYAPKHQPSEEHVENLTAKPFWDVASDTTNFPWAAKLEESSHIIISEFESKLARDQQKQKQQQQTELFTGDSAWQNKIMGSGWSAFRLQRLGEWNTENCKEFPRTYELLQSLDIPLAVRGVCFARQSPGSGVQPHSDGRNFILTSHLGLKVPEGCWIQVGDERQTWTEGKLTTLDTSFEHSTGNPTEEDRHVLIIDFWHPELSSAERAALEFIYDLRNQFEQGKIPFRMPRSLKKKREEAEKAAGEGMGLKALWSAFTGGDGDDK